MNPKDQCPECNKLIHSDPSHFRGTAASSATMLRCVLYQMYVLASSALALKTIWPDELTFKHPKLPDFTPQEPLKIAALISFRILYNFLYKGGDDFTISDFTPNGAARPPEPSFVGFENNVAFTKESINKFMAHLTWVRINKPLCIAQPRFVHGDNSIIKNAQLILCDAKSFVDCVCMPSNSTPVVLEPYGEGYRKIFEEAFTRLLAVKV